jgi:hypothetical protein
MPDRDILQLRADGVLDLPAAERLVEALRAARGSARVEVDLTRVRDFHDLGVMLVARALAERTGRVAVRGLRQHHVRLLRYLGIDTGATDLGSPVEAA